MDMAFNHRYLSVFDMLHLRTLISHDRYVVHLHSLIGVDTICVLPSTFSSLIDVDTIRVLPSTFSSLIDVDTTCVLAPTFSSLDNPFLLILCDKCQNIV